MTTLSLALRVALAHFDLAVTLQSDAQVIGIFGPSGSGKTTLLESIAGLRGGARGTLQVHGETWLDSDRHLLRATQDRDVGWVPQSGLLFPHLNVRANLLAGAPRARARGVDVQAIFERVCAQLELTPMLERGVSALSGGERQRVALGRALCSAPKLLLLDEPFASLDLPVRHRLWPRLRALRDALNVPMLLVSHDPTEVQALCDELIALRDGRVIARGTPRDVLTDRQVFALADQHGVMNLLAGTLHTDDADCVAEIAPAVLLHGRAVASSNTAKKGAPVMVSVPAQDVMIATREPAGLSARNVLPAQVSEIRPRGDVTLVVLQIAETNVTLFAEVALDTCERLGLAVGTRVHAVIKATSCSVFGI